tara:strand:- start:924 stop:3287 length:2364 start_codon:yes stop_codon:yes gene_type:complete
MDSVNYIWRYFLLIFAFQFIYAENNGIDLFQIGAHLPTKSDIRRNCLSKHEKQYIMESMLDIELENTRDTVLFRSPVGNGGMMNGDKQFITNYVDQNPSYGWIEDYSCYFITYDGHWGTDIAISGFYNMDEMTTPILAAAAGIVTYTHDGEFDRWTYWNNSAISNAVGLIHSNGMYTFYLHMKKNSVAVSLGDTVEVGDTLGFVGSSGFSDGPHLHFEVNNANWNLIDPWEGECNLGVSRWEDQIPFIGDSSAYTQRIFRYLNTAYPAQSDDEFNHIVGENIPSLTHINPGEDYMSLVAVRNLYSTDTLTWEWYKDGLFMDKISFVPGQTQWWYQGAPYYATSYWWINITWFTEDENVGVWNEKVYINNTLVGEKSFICNSQPNQIPMVASNEYDVELGQTVTGEFILNDDGEAFWFNLDSEPANGGLVEIFGGRRRKFNYTAPVDFIGADYIGISATDDRGVIGPVSYIIFNIGGIGLTNMRVEPSYVKIQENNVDISANLIGQSENIEVKAIIFDQIDNVSIDVMLSQIDGQWLASYTPEVESFFSVDLKLINNDIADTILYQGVGNFTSVGPLNILFNDTLSGELGSSVISEYSIQNNSDLLSVPEVSVFFIPEDEECISNYNSGITHFGGIGPGEIISSSPAFFVALITDECENGFLEFKAIIQSNQIEYWIEDFEVQLPTLSIKNNSMSPRIYSLQNAYPNPFNPVTTLHYDLPKASIVSLTIYDLNGGVVKNLVNNWQNAGYKSIRWNATNNEDKHVSAGLYLYVMETNGFRQSKKLVLLK